MKMHINKVRRVAYTAIAAVILGTVALPALTGSVSAAGQVSERKITMSNATPSAATTKYTISFKPFTTQTVGGIVVDICADSPIIGSTTCTYPAAFTFGATPTLTAGFTGMGTGWTASGSQGGAGGGATQVARLSNATPQTLTAGSAVTFELTGITNTSALGTFYARIYTFDTSANMANYTATGTTRVASPAGRVDYGGVALSTATVINVSATVQEQLTFCVSKTAPATGCTSLATPDVVLGSGTPKVLGTAVSTDTAYHQVTTNAVNGVSVALKNTSSITCAGLSRDSGATCLIAGRTTEGAIAASSALFGLHMDNGTGGTGTVTADTDYDGASAYNMPVTTYGDYGDPISSSTGAVVDVNSLMTYAAAAATATPAGVYSATHSLVATGTF